MVLPLCALRRTRAYDVGTPVADAYGDEAAVTERASAGAAAASGATWPASMRTRRDAASRNESIAAAARNSTPSGGARGVLHRHERASQAGHACHVRPGTRRHVTAAHALAAPGA
jgi:hypothetical protein